MISVENVIKNYGDNTALKGISFQVKDGEILGLLGPNGAGKSTTMNIMTGYISPTEGTVKIDDFDILKEPSKAKEKIGYLPEIPPLYMDMTVEEYLIFVAKIKKVPKNEIDDHIKNIVKKVKIEDVYERLIKNLSKGYRQRIGIAQAIIGNPKVLILDEPTVGLDPKQIIEIRNLIRELGKEHTIILSSHILSEVSNLCHRMVIIDKGTIVAEGTYEELSKSLAYSSEIDMRIKGQFNKVQLALKNVKNVEEVIRKPETEKGTVDIVVKSKKDCDIREELFNVLAKENLPILMMKPLNLDLEQIFLKVTEQ